MTFVNEKDETHNFTNGYRLLKPLCSINRSILKIGNLMLNYANSEDSSTVCPQQHWTEIITILIRLLNLGEQLSVYTIRKSTDFEDEYERFYFYILLAVGSATIIDFLFKNKLYKIYLSILVDIGELIAYLLLLERTSSLYITVFSFFGAEIVLHIFNIYLIVTDPHQPQQQVSYGSIKIKELIGMLIFRLFVYTLTNLGQLLYLFLPKASTFRHRYYEILTIFSLFIGSIAFDSMLDVLKYVKKIKRVNRQSFIGLILDFIIIPLSLIILGSLELRSKSLLNYDRGVYMYCIMSGATMIILFLTII
ncbi:unnamed protein product, partial [Didymodactylos carnosus]